MISLSNISIQYGGKFLFDDLSFTVTEKDRIGLVGKNGAGKSTLLKILTGEIRAETGIIAMDNNTSIGYLPQEMRLSPTLSVYEETAKAFAKIQQLEQQMFVLTTELADRTDYESAAYSRLVQQLADMQDELQQLGVANRRETIEKVLRGLGFMSRDLDRPLREFSGGWQMRIELAKILLQTPSFILLDEPTNHLDIEAIMWLEEYLATYPGGVILISHDRAFLDRVTTRTVELVSGKLYDYKASYSEFMELREQRIEKQITDSKRQSKEIEHTQMLIEKFRAKKNKAKFAQTLIRKLEKTERIEVDDMENAAISFRFPDAPHSGRIVVRLEQVGKQYGTKQVFAGIDMLIERGEKIAFVGRNGEGKTTLTRIIADKIPYDGFCELGHQVEIGYFEQHQAESLDSKKTVFQIIDDAATGNMRHRVRGLLGAFLFSGEDVEKRVSVLSGGEKSRLALAKMLLEPVNLLILDEPTNHLDMYAKEVLKQALFDFDGTLIVVSHDRDFLRDLTDKVYEFRDGQIFKYEGDVYGFLETRRLSSLDELNLGLRKQQQANANAQQTLSEADEKILRKQQQQAQYALDREIKSLAGKINKCEQRIAELEAEIGRHEDMMNDADFYTQQPNPQSVIENYAALKRQLQEAMDNWELLSIELEEKNEKLSAKD